MAFGVNWGSIIPAISSAISSVESAYAPQQNAAQQSLQTMNAQMQADSPTQSLNRTAVISDASTQMQALQNGAPQQNAQTINAQMQADSQPQNVQAVRSGIISDTSTQAQAIQQGAQAAKGS